MKRFNSLFAVLSFIVFLLTSCSKDKDKEETMAPQITLHEGIYISPEGNTYQLVYHDTTLVINQHFYFGINASTKSDKPLSRLTIDRQFGDNPIVILLDSTLNENSLTNEVFTAITNHLPGNEKIQITVTDGYQKSSSVSFNITTFDPDPPVVNFKTGIYPVWGIEYVSGDTTLPVQMGFVFGFDAETKSDKNLTKLLVRRIFQGVSSQDILDTTLNVATYSHDITQFAYPNAGQEEFRVIVTDGYGKSDSISFVITTTPGDPGIWVYTGIQMGSYENTTVNNAFAAVPGQTYSYAEATADTSNSIQTKIDWVYANSEEWGHTLMSPDYTAQVYTWYPEIALWTTKKNTDFGRTTLNSTQYNAIENKNQLYLTIQNQELEIMDIKYYSEKMSDPGGFAVGDIIAFRATPGKFGLIQVTQVNQGSDYGMSTITFNVKVFK